MSMQFTTTPIKQALTFPFQDEKWQSKMLIGILIMFLNYIIPFIPMLIIYGYMYQIMHRVLVGDGELHLPEWNDWGQHLGEGWRLFCVYFLYMLPAAIFYIGGYFVYITGMVGSGAMEGKVIFSGFRHDIDAGVFGYIACLYDHCNDSFRLRCSCITACGLPHGK